MAAVEVSWALLATQPNTTPKWSTRQNDVRESLSWKVYLPSCKREAERRASEGRKEKTGRIRSAAARWLHLRVLWVWKEGGGEGAGRAQRGRRPTLLSLASIWEAVFWGCWSELEAWWSAQTVRPRPMKQ